MTELELIKLKEDLDNNLDGENKNYNTNNSESLFKSQQSQILFNNNNKNNNNAQNINNTNLLNNFISNNSDESFS